jgi:hypothetical protein
MDSSQQALSQQVVELKQELRRTQTVGLLVG